jgi:S-adenosylmethionine synthetase
MFSYLCFEQVDRSGAYAARWVAKSLVKVSSTKRKESNLLQTQNNVLFQSGLCKRVLVQVAYAIGGEKQRRATKTKY